MGTVAGCMGKRQAAWASGWPQAMTQRQARSVRCVGALGKHAAPVACTHPHTTSLAGRSLEVNERLCICGRVRNALPPSFLMGMGKCSGTAVFGNLSPDVKTANLGDHMRRKLRDCDQRRLTWHVGISHPHPCFVCIYECALTGDV